MTRSFPHSCLTAVLLCSGLTQIGRTQDAPPPSTETLRLNELLASNRTGARDDAGETSDWLELHNSGSTAVSLEGYRLTDDLEDLSKWSFPKHRIRAGGYLVVWMSGRDDSSPTPSSLAQSTTRVPFETTLVAAGARWRFAIPRANEDRFDVSAWTTLRFDDSSFDIGNAGFGYGDDDDATEVPAGTTVVLTRHEFELNELPASQSLVLDVDYDDGFVAYLNGERVAAVNAPRGNVTAASVAAGNHDAGKVERFNLAAHASLLRVGKNVLAVAALNNSASSSDLSLNPSLGTLAPVCHATFRLSRKGGDVYLVAPNGRVVDQIQYGKQIADQSTGRAADERASLGYFLTPTPGAANSGPQHAKPVKARVKFDPPAGYHGEQVLVAIEPKSSAPVDIRYTKDGTPPDASSPIYEGPVDVRETTLLRAAPFVGEERAGAVVSATYLAGRRHSIHVLSISMAPQHFHDVHMQAAATGRESERPAFMELFDESGERVVASGFGLRLHGGAGRRGGFERKKSYRMYFRRTYGIGRLKYPLIPQANVEDFDKLVLRASSNDKSPHGSAIRDQVMRDVHLDMGALASAGSWCMLLVNGQNRGVYNVTERMDDDFLASHFGPGTFDVMKTGETVLSGTREEWDNLRRFVSSTDFSSDANFEKLAQRVDMQNLTSYIIVNLCLQNYDWPHNNWYAAHRVPDGKWIFLCWDSEWGLGYRHPGTGDSPYGVDTDPYAFMDSGGSWSGLIKLIFMKSLDNPGYCRYYQDEVRRHLAGPLSTKNILRHVRRRRDQIANDLAIEYEQNGWDMSRWQQQLDEVELFARECPKYFQRYTDEYFAQRHDGVHDDRVAVIAGRDGQRHIVYRTPSGELRELTARAEGAVEERVILPEQASRAAGRPAAFRVGDVRTVIYRDVDGRLQLLKSVENGRPWQHTDLTELVGLKGADSDPFAIVVDDVPHIVYTDDDGRIQEVWHQGGRWQQHPLPAAPRPAGAPSISATRSAIYVTYRTMFGVCCEQRLDRRAADSGERRWSPRITHRLPVEGQPVGFSAAGRWRLIFRSADEWRVRKPFIFVWDNQTRRGYQDFPADANVLIQASDQGRRFRQLDKISAAHMAGNPTVVADATRDRHYILYRDQDGSIQEAQFTQATGQNNRASETWQVENVTALAGAPPASGEPAGVVLPDSGARYYAYRGRDGHIHEVSFDTRWHHRDLTDSLSK